MLITLAFYFIAIPGICWFLLVVNTGVRVKPGLSSLPYALVGLIARAGLFTIPLGFLMLVIALCLKLKY